MNAMEYINLLTSNGSHHFYSSDAFKMLGGSNIAVRAQLRRLKQQGLIANPMRGFHVIIPPEYLRLGCLPAEHFIDHLMRFLGEPYYIGLLSAAERHGAAHQKPQYCQVIVQKNRKGVSCGHIRVKFIARGNMNNMPVSIINTPRGVVRYSTPEVTALELTGYPNHSGGLSNVATVIIELACKLNPVKLLEAAALSPISWTQRLGYILDSFGEKKLAGSIELLLKDHMVSYTPLRRTAPTAGAKRNPKWKIIINSEIELDI